MIMHASESMEKVGESPGESPERGKSCFASVDLGQVLWMEWELLQEIHSVDGEPPSMIVFGSQNRFIESSTW